MLNANLSEDEFYAPYSFYWITSFWHNGRGGLIKYTLSRVINDTLVTYGERK